MDIQSGFADINGTRLYYEVAGAGHPLVLVHAGITDSRMWDAQFQAFAQHYQVVRYDMREYGRSMAVTGVFSHHEDLYALLKFLGIEQAHVIGCSKGGTTAINLALTEPNMVTALITVCSSPGGFYFEGAPPVQLDEIELAMDAEDFERASELEVQVWVDGAQRTPDQVDKSIRDLVREMNIIALKNEAQALGNEQSITPAAIERLSEIRVPTLVILGELDAPRAIAGSEWIAANITDAKKVVMSGTAHLPNMERPDEFNQHVLTFLNKLG